MKEKRFRVEEVNQNLSQLFQAVDREELVIIERGPSAPDDDLVVITRKQFEELKAQRDPGFTTKAQRDPG